MKTGISVLAFALLAACASNPSDGGSDAAKLAKAEEDEKKGIVCTYEKPTGSFLKEKRCTTLQQREAEARQRETLLDTRNARDSGL